MTIIYRLRTSLKRGRLPPGPPENPSAIALQLSLTLLIIIASLRKTTPTTPPSATPTFKFVIGKAWFLIFYYSRYKGIFTVTNEQWLKQEERKVLLKRFSPLLQRRRGGYSRR